MWDREEKQRVEELVEGRIDARQIPKCLEKTIANPLFIDLLFKLCKYMKVHGSLFSAWIKSRRGAIPSTVGLREQLGLPDTLSDRRRLNVIT